MQCVKKQRDTAFEYNATYNDYTYLLNVVWQRLYQLCNRLDEAFKRDDNKFFPNYTPFDCLDSFKETLFETQLVNQFNVADDIINIICDYFLHITTSSTFFNQCVRIPMINATYEYYFIKSYLLIDDYYIYDYDHDQSKSSIARYNAQDYVKKCQQMIDIEKKQLGWYITPQYCQNTIVKAQCNALLKNYQILQPRAVDKENHYEKSRLTLITFDKDSIFYRIPNNSPANSVTPPLQHNSVRKS